MKQTTRILAICFLVFSISEAKPAEITFQPPWSQLTMVNPDKQDAVFNGIGIEGVIESGDFEKFEEIVEVVGGLVNSVAIASPGGDIVEAMKIGRLIREMRYETRVPHRMHPESKNIISFGLQDTSNNICTSSCFFIYVAGVNRFGNIVGIHRPYLSKEEYKKMDIDDAFEASAFLKDLVADYLTQMGVPTEYADRAFMISSHDIEWLEQDEIKKNFSGYVPEIDEWISAQCPSLTEVEQSLFDDWNDGNGGNLTESQRAMLWEKLTAIEDCKSSEHSRLSCKAWEKKYWEKEYRNFPNSLCAALDYRN